MTFAPLRGFRDYLPPDAGARSAVRARLRAAARRSGFVEIETPSVESLELFEEKSGTEIRTELFAFRDKGDRPVTLVAETTPSLARLFVERGKAEPLPVKWFNVGRLWRYEEPQSGRTREFGQVNLDLLGAPGAPAEVEILLAAARLLDAAGADGLYQIHVNDRALVEGFGRTLGATDGAMFLRALDRSRKGSRAEFVSDLGEAGLAEDAIERLLAEVDAPRDGIPADEAVGVLKGWAARGLADPGPEGARRLQTLFELLGTTPIRDRVVLDLRVVRGLAYYTSTVFEAFDRSAAHRALLGGGRYDRLIEQFGGPPTPACGFALGDQTLELLLRAAGRWPDGEPPLDTFVVAISPAELPVALEIAERLRSDGLSAEVDLMGRPVARQLREAARRRARRALLVGPAELARGMVVERDLTTGAQREVPRARPGGDAAGSGPA